MISGKEFKSKYPTTIFYKLTNETENHNGFQFQDGLNIDTYPININECSQGGLYFTDKNNILRWIKYNGKEMKYIREVEILDDSLIFIEDKKYKTNKFILKQRQELTKNNMVCKLAVQQNCLALKYVKNQTNEICKLAVQQCGYALPYVKNQTDEICILAVQQYGYALPYVKNQTEEICKLAVQQNGCALQYVKNQTDEICKLAVQQNGYALPYVKNQTEEICKLAVQQNIHALQYVKNQTEEICKLAVQQNESSLIYIKKNKLFVDYTFDANTPRRDFAQIGHEYY